MLGISCSASLSSASSKMLSSISRSLSDGSVFAVIDQSPEIASSFAHDSNSADLDMYNPQIRRAPAEFLRELALTGRLPHVHSIYPDGQSATHGGTRPSEGILAAHPL